MSNEAKNNRIIQSGIAACVIAVAAFSAVVGGQSLNNEVELTQTDGRISKTSDISTESNQIEADSIAKELIDNLENGIPDYGVTVVPKKYVPSTPENQPSGEFGPPLMQNMPYHPHQDRAKSARHFLSTQFESVNHQKKNKLFV